MKEISSDKIGKRPDKKISRKSTINDVEFSVNLTNMNTKPGFLMQSLYIELEFEIIFFPETKRKL